MGAKSNGRKGWDRTSDSRIMIPVLYRLSYFAKGGSDGIRTRDLLRDGQAP